MLEKDFTAKLMKADALPKDCKACEVKITKNRTLPFSSFADHQIHHLLKVKHSRFVYKLRDVGNFRKPFDIIVFDHDPAYTVLGFAEDNYKHTYSIDIDTFWKEMCTGKKSITRERAEEIGVKIKI